MTTGLLVVIPALVAETTDICVESILAPKSAAGFLPGELLLIDNSRDGTLTDRYPGIAAYRDPEGHNLGVARSWNVGAQKVLARGLDYLVLCSASMRFGPELHCTWRSQMETFWGADVIEADGHSWHAIAIHRRLFELIGLFDSNYWPGYQESIDWCTRLRFLNREGGWPRVWFNALSQGQALGMHQADLHIPWEPLRDYYRAKWSGDKGEEQFRLPFGDKPMGWFEDVPIPVLAQRYGLEEGRWW